MIYGQAHAFDPNEVIFELEMKNDTPCYEVKGLQTDCFACKDKLKKSSVCCEFCAMKYCSDCRQRSRPFPNSITLENGEKILGKICKICDRKFLMLQQYKKLVSGQNSPIPCSVANNFYPCFCYAGASNGKPR